MEAIGEQCVGLDEPTSFLDHVYLGCTQRECQPNEIVIKEKREDVRITNLCRSDRKITRVRKSLTRRRWRGLTTWMLMRKSALRGVVVSLQIKNYGAVVQSLSSLLG